MSWVELEISVLILAWIGVTFADACERIAEFIRDTKDVTP